MKRSHARLEVAKLLTDVFDDEMALKRANFLLAKIEELGFLPPAHNAFEGRENTFNDKMFVNKWEPEDAP